MIRFACPGCGATFTVGDEKAGKTGKCPKCSSQFVIPDAEAAEGAAPPPSPPALPPLPQPTPKPDANGPVEIAPCPKCSARLSVEAGDLGLDVECPNCATVYPALRPSDVKAKQPAAGRNRPEVVDDEDDRPSRRSRRVVAEDEGEERPSRRRRDEDDEEDEEPRPSRGKKSKRKKSRDVDSKRVTAALLAIFLGHLGIHKFYLGYKGPGFIMLVANLLTCFTVVPIIALIEGIIYLTKSDEDFIETYQIGSKEWF